MAYRTVNKRPCSRCGVPTDRTAKPYKPLLCTDCGLTDAVRAAWEMRTKQGAAWLTWLGTAGPTGRKLPPK